ncbi:hypothetical protein V6R86_06090 [Sphingomonas kaistensis]|uniref:Uncharacterized protein n=1 Tax=Sphingomonas kaistensis TaxID=298708 RepID=A0ABZ2G3A1_9SPHN
MSVRLGGPHPLHFGVGRRWLQQLSRTVPTGLSPDARLFATAYAAGFFAVSLFIF